MLSVTELARRDMARFSSDEKGFTAEITFQKPDGTGDTSIIGMANKIHFNVDYDGKITNETNASICVHEDVLTAAGYTVRNGDNEVNLQNHRVSWADSTGVVKKYVITKVHPDETLGAILMFLGAFNE